MVRVLLSDYFQISKWALNMEADVCLWNISSLVVFVVQICYPCCRWAISTSCCYLTFFVDEIFPCLYHHIVILLAHEICCHRCQTIQPAVNIGWLVVFLQPTNLRTCDRKQLTRGSPAPTPTLAATRPAPLTRARNGGEGCRGRGGDQHVRGQPRGLRRRRRGPRRLHLHPRGLSCRWVLRLLRF